MRLVLQRVTRASVSVDGDVVGRIGAGLVALVGVAAGDTHAEAERAARKTAALRLFDDPDGGPERSVADASGSVLVISQFTLLGDTRRGNRPSWQAAARPDEARGLVDAFAAELRAAGVTVATGRFGAHMTVDLVNDGPFTVILDTDP